MGWFITTGLEKLRASSNSSLVEAEAIGIAPAGPA